MRASGARTLLVSGGFTLFADQVAATLGFDFVSANVLEFSGKPGQRVLTGKVVPPIRDRTDKLERLTEQAGRYRIPLTETIAVGVDGSHIAFSHGLHYCLGAPLARLEGRVAFETLLAAYPGMRLAVPHDKVERRVSRLIRGLTRLPVVLGERAD